MSRQRQNQHETAVRRVANHDGDWFCARRGCDIVLQGGEPASALEARGSRALLQCAIFLAREIESSLGRNNELRCGRTGANKLRRRSERYGIHACVTRENHCPCAITLKSARPIQVFYGKVTGTSRARVVQIGLSTCSETVEPRVPAGTNFMNHTDRMA